MEVVQDIKRIRSGPVVLYSMSTVDAEQMDVLWQYCRPLISWQWPTVDHVRVAGMP